MESFDWISAMSTDQVTDDACVEIALQTSSFWNTMHRLAEIPAQRILSGTVTSLASKLTAFHNAGLPIWQLIQEVTQPCATLLVAHYLHWKDRADRPNKCKPWQLAIRAMGSPDGDFENAVRTRYQIECLSAVVAYLGENGEAVTTLCNGILDGNGEFSPRVINTCLLHLHLSMKSDAFLGRIFEIHFTEKEGGITLLTEMMEQEEHVAKVFALVNATMNDFRQAYSVLKILQTLTLCLKRHGSCIPTQSKIAEYLLDWAMNNTPQKRADVNSWLSPRDQYWTTIVLTLADHYAGSNPPAIAVGEKLLKLQERLEEQGTSLSLGKAHACTSLLCSLAGQTDLTLQAFRLVNMPGINFDAYDNERRRRDLDHNIPVTKNYVIGNRRMSYVTLFLRSVLRSNEAVRILIEHLRVTPCLEFLEALGILNAENLCLSDEQKLAMSSFPMGLYDIACTADTDLALRIRILAIRLGERSGCLIEKIQGSGDITVDDQQAVLSVCKIDPYDYPGLAPILLTLCLPQKNGRFYDCRTEAFKCLTKMGHLLPKALWKRAESDSQQVTFWDLGDDLLHPYLLTMECLVKGVAQKVASIMRQGKADDKLRFACLVVFFRWMDSRKKPRSQKGKTGWLSNREVFDKVNGITKEDAKGLLKRARSLGAELDGVDMDNTWYQIALKEGLKWGYLLFD